MASVYKVYSKSGYSASMKVAPKNEWRATKLDIKLENPKQFLPLLLFLGVVLVLLGTLMQATSLSNDGWIVVGIAVILWVFSKFAGSESR